MDVDVSMIDIWDGTTRAGGQKFFYTQHTKSQLKRHPITIILHPWEAKIWDRPENTVYLQQGKSSVP